jgi:hypothetical protein
MNGFDAGDPAFGVPRAVYPGASWFDVMSYCNNQWISDYTYNGMYTNMLANPSLLNRAAMAEDGRTVLLNGNFLSLGGRVDPIANSASLSFIARLNSVSSVTSPIAGPYAIKLLNAGGTVLATYGFSPTALDDSSGMAFDGVYPFVTGARVVQIVRTADGALLMSRAISANAPLISAVALQGASTPVSGVVTLGWTASDPDGDALTFDVFYSRDAGTTWQPALMGTSGQSALIDTARLAGSDSAIFRVVASDGVNTTEASSAAFALARKVPEAFVLLPANGTRVRYGQLVNFSAVALDAQDGIVAQANLRWATSTGVALGSGGLASADALPVGANTIFFTATNSAGLSTSSSVTVFVDDDLNTPGPVLSAGPMQVGWHIAPQTTAAQVTQLSLTNAGSGNVSWMASVNATWLTISPTNGTIASDGDPLTLRVIGDPTGLAPNTTHAAFVTLVRAPSGSDDVTQTLKIPVSLGIGNTHNPVVRAQRTYLPLAQRQ